MSASPPTRHLADEPLTTLLADRSEKQPLISAEGWIWCCGLGVLFVFLFRSFLWRMYRIATGEWGGDWSHALIVPVISSYFIFQNRHRLVGASLRAYWPGLVILFAGLFSFAWCIYPVRNDMLQGYSMIMSLFGLVLFLMGPGRMQMLWFPICYLALGVKISDRIWEQIAWKLQLVAAQSAALVMQFMQVDASVQGSTIELTFQRDGQWVIEPINVAEACSGLRMLMAFVALGAAVAYLVERAWWKRIVLLVLAVPIAVVINIGRVTVVGLLSIVNPELSQGDFHVFVGMLMLIPAAGLFMLVGWVLDRSVIDDENASHVATRVIPKVDSLLVPSRQWALGVKGFILGIFLTALIGVEYGLLLASWRPEDLFGGSLNRVSAWLLCLGGLVVLAGGIWSVRSLLSKNPATGLASRSISLGVLLAAVLGLNGVVQATRIVLVKQPVPVRRSLALIPKQVGPWVMDVEEKRLSAEAVEALGTKQYTSRLYRDTSRIDRQPGARVQLHVAYYTGTPDTVPHVPDRCFVAGGVRGIGIDRAQINLSGPGYFKDENDSMAASKLHRSAVRIPNTTIPATLFTFADPNRPTQLSNVVYFFIANGKFLATPEWVRATAFDPRDRYSYYCKIEVRLFDVADPVMAAERSSEFLSAMMPEILACLPDWIDVTEGRWPASESLLP